MPLRFLYSSAIWEQASQGREFTDSSGEAVPENNQTATSSPAIATVLGFRFFGTPGLRSDLSSIKPKQHSVFFSRSDLAIRIRLTREKRGKFSDFFVLSLCVTIPNTTLYLPPSSGPRKPACTSADARALISSRSLARQVSSNFSNSIALFP